MDGGYSISPVLEKTLGPTYFGQRITVRTDIQLHSLTIHTSEWWTRIRGEEIPFNDQRAEGYAILGTGWVDTYSREATPGFFRIYIRGGYVYIKDPQQ